MYHAKKFFTIIATAALLMLLPACSTTEEPVNLNNTSWTANQGDFSFEGEVFDDTLEIRIKSGETKALYWSGNFEIPEGTTGDFSTISIADRSALDPSLFGSSLSEKHFNYTDGKIVFEFEALGTTTDIEMSRN